MNDMRERLIELLSCANFDYYEMVDESHERGVAVTESFEEWCADHLLANGVTVQEWISVNDRLPKVGDDVLVAVFDGWAAYTSVDFIMNDGKWCCNTGNQKVTHWCELPKPPKGE